MADSLFSVGRCGRSRAQSLICAVDSPFRRYYSIAALLFAPLVIAACATGSPTPTILAPATRAASTQVAPSGPAAGQWQLVIEAEELPAGRKLPTQTMALCSTPDDKKQWQDMVGGKTAAGCAITDYLAVGPIISYTMRCAGGVEGATLISIVDDDHYRGESRLMLRNADKPAEIRSRVVATRLAPTCSK